MSNSPELSKNLNFDTITMQIIKMQACSWTSLAQNSSCYRPILIMDNSKIAPYYQPESFLIYITQIWLSKTHKNLKFVAKVLGCSVNWSNSTALGIYCRPTCYRHNLILKTLCSIKLGIGLHKFRKTHCGVKLVRVRVDAFCLEFPQNL